MQMVGLLLLTLKPQPVGCIEHINETIHRVDPPSRAGCLGLFIMLMFLFRNEYLNYCKCLCEIPWAAFSVILCYFDCVNKVVNCGQ